MKIICIEGLDGTGKYTLAQYLCGHLTNMGYKTKVVSAPFYDSRSGEVISAYLHGEYGDFTQMTPMRASAMYINDRIANKDQYNCEDYDYLILDRFYFSNLMYQACKLDMSAGGIKNLSGLSAASVFSLMDLFDLEYLGDIGCLGLQEYINNMTVFVLRLDEKSRQEQINARREAAVKKCGINNTLDQHEANYDYMNMVNSFTMRYLNIVTPDFRKYAKELVEIRCEISNCIIEETISVVNTLYSKNDNMSISEKYFAAYCAVHPHFDERTPYIINILINNPDFRYRADDFYKLFAENIIPIETTHAHNDTELDQICENNANAIMNHILGY